VDPTVGDRYDLTQIRNRLISRPPSKLQEDLPVASVAIIINPNDRGGSVLLIRRTERSSDPWSGQIGFPGGHKSPDDQSFLQTSIRETKEEVGVRLKESQLLGSLPMVTTLSRRVQVAPFVFELESAVEVRANREVAESFWVPLLTLSQLQVKEHNVRLEDRNMRVDSFDYEGRIIWGLTFRILNLMLGRRLSDEV